MSELAAQQSSIAGKQSEDEKFILQAAKDGAIPPDVLQELQKDPSKIEDVKKLATYNYSILGNIKATKNRLELLSKQDKINSDAVMKAASNLTGSILLRASSLGLASATGSYSAKGLQERVASALSDGKIGPEEQKQIQSS